MTTPTIITILVSMGFQPFWAFQVIKSAETHDIEVAELAGVILSEHSGGFTEASATAVNPKSGCVGLGQIAPFWARHFNVPKSYLYDPMRNVDITARVIARLKKEHRRHERKAKHGWLAHYKCGVRSLDTCKGPPRRTKRYINSVRIQIGGLASR